MTNNKPSKEEVKASTQAANELCKKLLPILGLYPDRVVAIAISDIAKVIALDQDAPLQAANAIASTIIAKVASHAH